MCGIVGFSGKPKPESLTEMLASIVHRGPDDEAKQETENFSLGMRRLAIIDLVHGLYPMTNENHAIHCVFNGEIYNYKQLRAELKKLGHDFKSQSDSEVIVHGYEEWGNNVFCHLRGMFAIAIYDSRQEKLVIARDRLGIKPLYYTNYEGRFIFASEIKALFAGWNIGHEADDSSVYRFLLKRLHDDRPQTFFHNVTRLQPAHYIEVFADGTYESKRYWEPAVNTQFHSEKSDTEYAEGLREEFMRSMQLHMIADVPLGVGLSGGLDSSGITGVAAKLMRSGTETNTDQKLLTFSAIHPGLTIDESGYIDEVINFTDAEAHKVAPSVDKFWEELELWLHHQEEPTISTAPYAYYTVMREAAKHVKVLLSGQGGDEIFAGYIPYFMSYVHSAADANALLAILRESVLGFDMYRGFLVKKLKQRLDRKEVLDVNELVNHEGQAYTETFQLKRNLNERLAFDIQSGSIPNLLRYEDKNSMAHSLESRVPFLDHKFVEYALALPISQKIKYGWNRYVYREAMQGLMPEKNRKRRSKVGFVNNEWEWMVEKKEKVLEIFSSTSFSQRKYWNAEKVITEFEAATKGERQGDWLMFWRILSVELWLRSQSDVQ